MNHFTHPSSWSSAQLRDLAATEGRARWQTSDPVLAMQVEATLAAVQQWFGHLSSEAIFIPPHRWFDAALARQVLIYTLVEEFGLARRLVSAVSRIPRASFVRVFRVIEERGENPEFARMLSQVAATARKNFEQGGRS